jgi:hypothetical protein
MVIPEVRVEESGYGSIQVDIEAILPVQDCGCLLVDPLIRSKDVWIKLPTWINEVGPGGMGVNKHHGKIKNQELAIYFVSYLSGELVEW